MANLACNSTLKGMGMKKIQLKPRIVTGITASFMVITTLVSSMAIVENSRAMRVIEYANAEDLRAQIIEKNMEIRWGRRRHIAR